MMVMLNRTPTRPHPIFSSKDLAKAYRPPYIRAPNVLTAKILARAANGTEGHLRERTFGRVWGLAFGRPRGGRIDKRRGGVRIKSSHGGQGPGGPPGVRRADVR